MFKNISRYIIIIVLITAACSFISYSIFHSPFSFNSDFQLWAIRIILYVLFGWWLLRISFKQNIGEFVGLAVVICSISYICTDSRMIYYLIQNKYNGTNIPCFIGLGITIIWLIYILSRSKTILGLFLMINTIFSIFILLPYGIPRLEISFLGGQGIDGYLPTFDFTCFPFYIINDYRPFQNQTISTFSVLLDIRTLTSLIFFGYLLILSFIQTKRIIYEDNLAAKILTTENSILQFFQAGAYFVWKIIQRFFFFGKSFFYIFFQNVWKQIKNSIQSYIYALLIVCAFIIPYLVLHISNGIYFHELNSKISLPNFDQIFLIFAIIILWVIPLLLLKLLKSTFDPFTIYTLNAKERPTLYPPIYITAISVGLTSIIDCFVIKSFGNYLIFFIAVVIYIIFWGYQSYKQIQ